MATLAYGLLRTHMARQLAMVADVGAQLGHRSTQVLALRAGKAVVLHRDQLAMIGDHPSKAAVNLDASEWWTLGVDDQLEPAGAPA